MSNAATSYIAKLKARSEFVRTEQEELVKRAARLHSAFFLGADVTPAVSEPMTLETSGTALSGVEYDIAVMADLQTWLLSYLVRMEELVDLSQPQPSTATPSGASR